MKNRTTSRSVIFAHPFVLRSGDDDFPAGSYRIDTEEALLESLSFTAYRRVSTLMHYDPAGTSGYSLSVNVIPSDLEAALVRDATHG